MDQIDQNKEIEYVELCLYRTKFVDSVGVKYREEAGIPEDSVPSSVRELCRTGFIDIDETYSVWYPSSWDPLDAAIGEVVDTFDAEDNITPGWETFDITDVVRDSLGTERNRVNFVLKMRDELKSYNRLVTYSYGHNTENPIDTSGYTAEKLAQLTRVKVVYKDDVGITPKTELSLNKTTVVGGVRIYTVSGRLVATVSMENLKSPMLLHQDNYNNLPIPKGIYIVCTGVGKNSRTGKIRIN